VIRAARVPLPALVLLATLLAAAAPDARATPAEPAPGAASAPPTGLPDDLPLYAGAVPVSSMASPGKGTVVNLRSADAPELVFEWYRAELPKHGWTLDKQNGAGDQHLITARKDGRKASLLISARKSADAAAPGETQVLLIVSEEH